MNEIQYEKEAWKNAKGRPNVQNYGGGDTVIEASEVVDQTASDHGLGYLINVLGVEVPYMIDNFITTKAEAVDMFIRELMAGEGRRDSLMSYKEILNRLWNSPRSLEETKQAGKGVHALGSLFQQAAVHNGMSSETYRHQVSEVLKYNKVENKKEQLKRLLANI